jgi:hypothetical protein
MYVLDYTVVATVVSYYMYSSIRTTVRYCSSVIAIVVVRVLLVELLVVLRTEEYDISRV